jgi:drug/metabolite transporter (DMT)-like permease
MEVAARPGMRTAVLFVLASAVFATNYLWVKLAIEMFTPVQVAWGRSFFAAITLLIVLVITGDRLPRDRQVWKHLFIAALLFNTISFTCMAIAMTRISTVQASVVNSTAPLVTLALVAAFVPIERITGPRLFGVLLGFVGVVILVQPWAGWGATDLWGILAIFGATASYAAGIVYARLKLGNASGSAVAIAAGQLSLASIQLTLVLPLGFAIPAAFELSALIGLVVLGIFGTGIGYILQHSLIRAGGASVAGDATYLILLFAVLIGITVLGEPLQVTDAFGAAVILIGLVIATRVGRGVRLGPAPTVP